MEMKSVKYRITEVARWVIVSPSGNAEDYEPVRVRDMLRRRLAC